MENFTYMENYDWIKEIDYKAHLKGDIRLIIDIIGMDNYLRLVETFGKTQLYISDQSLIKIKRTYIKRYYHKHTIKELSQMLDVSESFVRKVINEAKKES